VSRIVIDFEIAEPRGRGGVSPEWRAKLDARDAALRRLRAALCPKLTTNSAAVFIGLLFKRYQDGRWKFERNNLVAPCKEPERTFWRCLRDFENENGPRFPKGDRLRQILSNSVW
jgi:hypothetical protein